MKLAPWVIGCFPLLAQTAGVVTKTAGDEVRLEISANSQPGREPISLKWDVIYPAQLMEWEGASTGPAAAGAGKSLQCTARAVYASGCILSGGAKPIGNGVIAVYRFRIKTTAEAGPTTLRIENAESTTSDSKKWSLQETEAAVIIR